jgi:uncharacterized protein (TIGR02117 family)
MLVCGKRFPILRDRPVRICAGRRLIIDMLELGHGSWLHLKLFRINSLWTAFRALVGWPLLAIGLYFLAALIGSFIPANNGWREPAAGIPIFVETNGVHVSLILPMAAAGEDLSDFIRPEHLTDRDLYGTHAMIGWGHGRVYRNAQYWRDVRSGDIASAIFGSNYTTLHIYHLIDPQPAGHRKRFYVSEAQYKHIVADVRGTFRLAKDGNSKAYPAYGPNNLFYDSNGRYTAINTCNEWTASILRRAGVRIGIWTPMAGGVMRWF